MSENLFGPTGGDNSKGKDYSNPFQSYPLQYLPLNIDHMLWWAEHFMRRFGFYRNAVRRIASYFVTNFSIECDDEKLKEEITAMLEKADWRDALVNSGESLIAYGNVFLSINQPFTRSLNCPSCKKTFGIEKIDFKYDNFKYCGTCPSCKTKVDYQPVDSVTKELQRTRPIFWPAREVKVQHDPTSLTSHYYWDIPPEFVSSVKNKKNNFHAKYTPKPILECIKTKSIFKFNNNNILHLKFPTPASIRTDGKGIPPCIFMFDDFFVVQTLKRLNEVIAFEDIVPFRVFSMSGQSDGRSNPILNQDGEEWQASIENMISTRRKDPGAYHTVPFALNYQQLASEGKELAPVDFLKYQQSEILNALNIPVELYNMSISGQAVTPALRLFENCWSMIPNAYEQILQHWVDKATAMQQKKSVKIKLVRVTVSDDMERKSIIGQLVASNSIARSELLKIYNLDMEEQMRAKMKEDELQKKLVEEQQRKEQIEQMSVGDMFNQQQQGGGQPQPGSGGSTPGNVLEQAKEIAQQLFPQDGAGRRSQLQQIKGQDETLYSAVKAQLEALTSQARSQGVQQARQPQG